MAHKKDILNIYAKEVESIKEAGLFKGEAPFVSPQGARVRMEDGRELLCMCANNYLGLGNNCRTNKPSTVGINWRWRVTQKELSDSLQEDILAMTKRYGRMRY